MAQYGIQKVLVVRGYDIITDKPMLTLKFLKETKFTNGQESVALTAQGTAITHFDHSKSLTISGNSATIDDMLLALQVGKDVEVLTSNTGVRITETITVTNNAGTLKYTPTGTSPSQIKFAEVLDANGSQIKVLDQASTIGANKFTLTSKALAFNTGELVDGTKVRVSYYPTIASVRKIQNLVTNSSATLRWECEAVFKDACTSQEKKGQIVIPKGKIDGKFEWSLSEKGEPAVHNFTIMAEQTCDEQKLWDMFVYDQADIT